MADEGAVETGSEQGTLDVGAGEGPYGDDTWSDSARSRINELKSEAQKYREELDPYKKTYSDPNAAIYHEAAQALLEGRTEDVAGWHLASAAASLGVDVDTLLAVTQSGKQDAEGSDEPQYMTRAEVDQMLKEQAQSQQQQAMQQQMQPGVGMEVPQEPSEPQVGVANQSPLSAASSLREETLSNIQGNPIEQ